MNPQRSVHPEAVAALFPALGRNSFCEVNLDEEAARWRGRHPETLSGGSNPLLEPTKCQRFLDNLHARLGVDWSYGGYLEDRRHLLQGSYLERTGGFVHLGVDFSVPRCTLVAAPCPAVVFLVDDDHDRDGGWGPRVFLKQEGEPADSLVLIFAHLQEIQVTPGIRLPRGTVFAEVGGPPDNGNWIPHLHIQAVSPVRLVEVLIEHFAELDGYGLSTEIESLRLSFPDPLPSIGW
jgi:murein DD-endopeptidase MepM/ murein hydrolase activator NlpD